jgi:hypothetical protein
MPGKTELARIHVLKKEAGLNDSEYRILLSGAAGVTSAAEIKLPDQYCRVIAALEKYLVSIGKPPTGRPVPVSKQRTLYEAVEIRARHILGPGHQNRLAGYLKKMGKQELTDCSDIELRRVMGFLSSIERKEKGIKGS